MNGPEEAGEHEVELALPLQVGSDRIQEQLPDSTFRGPYCLGGRSGGAVHEEPEGLHLHHRLAQLVAREQLHHLPGVPVVSEPQIAPESVEKKNR